MNAITFRRTWLAHTLHVTSCRTFFSYANFCSLTIGLLTRIALCAHSDGSRLRLYVPCRLSLVPRLTRSSVSTGCLLERRAGLAE